VTGLRAGGLLHQFKVQPISVNGPLGQPAFSDWMDFGELAGDNSQGQMMEASVALSFFSQFNAEHGVAAWMRWNRKEEAKIESELCWIYLFLKINDSPKNNEIIQIFTYLFYRKC
jgi:hypothetical protein